MILKFIKSSYDNVKKALAKTGSLLGHRLRHLFGKPLNEEALEELEKLLYEADVGVQTAIDLTEKVKAAYEQNPQLTSDELIGVLKTEILRIIQTDEPPPILGHPHTILIVGVNGNGKTTSVAKLAKRYQMENKKVLLGAADTFRAAAMEQLSLWADQLGVEVVRGAPQADPAAVAFDTMTAAKAREVDVAIIDTAGRLHTKSHLMQELEKIRRSIKKVENTGPHETLLVLDATAGQNAIDQAKTFSKFTPLTGLILTKLDGTAKGGIIVAIRRQLGVPVRFIGVGEGIEDLVPFDAPTFVDALLEVSS